MISQETFAKQCAELIRKKMPFVAYWHTQGTGTLILDGGEATEYTVKYKYGQGGKVNTAQERTTNPVRMKTLLSHGGKVIRERTVRKTPMASTVTGFRRAIQKMNKDRHIRGLCTVESDGSGYIISGDGLMELIKAMGV